MFYYLQYIFGLSYWNCLLIFDIQLSWKRTEGKSSENYLALTGPVPDLDAWSAALPHPLDMKVKDWRPCKLAA